LIDILLNQQKIQTINDTNEIDELKINDKEQKHITSKTEQWIQAELNIELQELKNLFTYIKASVPNEIPETLFSILSKILALKTHFSFSNECDCSESKTIKVNDGFSCCEFNMDLYFFCHILNIISKEKTKENMKEKAFYLFDIYKNLLNQKILPKLSEMKNITKQAKDLLLIYYFKIEFLKEIYNSTQQTQISEYEHTNTKNFITMDNINEYKNIFDDLIKTNESFIEHVFASNCTNGPQFIMFDLFWESISFFVDNDFIDAGKMAGLLYCQQENRQTNYLFAEDVLLKSYNHLFHDFN